MALTDQEVIDLLETMSRNVNELAVIMRGMSERLFTLEEKVNELEDDDLS